ncbi:SPOR domain-containing protein [Myroides sp. M-43]|uniref:HU domain-containing protein n=1 Tax=Myroides oncorhynchi TaxID=2893756 RepID=UPI001E4E9C3D|nr:SPOR domain-containing protein [Myroides oncorhynchi]MCC9042194.1 SPOR domain-containing protein [Myroides oncorhynchi]
MKIEKYISALLYRYQCVIIPGFGALLTEIKSSYYSEEKLCFFPPQKSLSFNVNIKHNDGLLANHIATEESISYDEAVLLIKTEVNRWNLELTNIGRLSLTSIGVFQSNNEGNLVFEPIINSNYLTTSFGLSTVDANMITRTPIVPLIETVAVPVAKKNKVFTYLKYAAVIAIFASTASVLVNNGYEAYLNDQSYIVEKNVQAKVQGKIQQATFIIEPAATTISIPVKEEVIEEAPVINNTPYHIIACAFRAERTSEAEALKLRQKGFENAVALPRTKYGVYPVSYGGHATQNQAQTEMRKIHNTINIDAWILVQ